MHIMDILTNLINMVKKVIFGNQNASLHFSNLSYTDKEKQILKDTEKI